MCINNIVQKQIFKDKLDEVLYIWNSLDDIKNMLKKRNFILEEIKLDNFENLKQLQNDSVFLIDNNKHFMVIKNVETKWFLLNPIKRQPEEFTNEIFKTMNLMKNNNNSIFAVYKVIKIQGNSSIEINKINMNSSQHNDDYGN